MSSILQGVMHVGAVALPAWFAMVGTQSAGQMAEQYGARVSRVVDGLKTLETCSDAAE